MFDYLISYIMVHIACGFVTIIIYEHKNKINGHNGNKVIKQSFKYGPIALITALFYAIKT